MDVAICLFVLAGTIGSVDILYYHLYKFRLSQRPGSRLETCTHIFRAFTFAITAWALAGYTPTGAWYWLLLAIVGADFADEIVDVALEPKSRAALGGLPPLEYLVHAVSSVLMGGAWVSFATSGWSGRLEPTALAARTSALPAWLVLDAQLLAVGSVLLGLTETALLIRGLMASPRPSPERA